jgi:hypothetical protein
LSLNRDTARNRAVSLREEFVFFLLRQCHRRNLPGAVEQ